MQKGNEYVAVASGEAASPGGACGRAVPWDRSRAALGWLGYLQSSMKHVHLDTVLLLLLLSGE